MNSELCTVLATLITSLIIKYFTMEESYYRILYPAIFSILPFLKFTDFKNYNFNDYISYNLIYIIPVLIIYKFREYINLLFRKIFFCEHVFLTTYMTEEIQKFEQYVGTFPEFYDNPEKIYNGSIELLTLSKDTIECNNMYLNKTATHKRSEYGHKIYFNDKNFNVKGYYEWNVIDVEINDVIEVYKENNKSETKNSKARKIPYPYITIHMEKNSKINVKEYFASITNKIKEIEDNKNYIKIFHCITHKQPHKHDIGYIKSILYEGEKNAIKELENIYIKTLFHKEKNILWKTIKEIHFNPNKFYEL